MGKILLLEFRRNLQSLFLYVALFAAGIFQFVGLLKDEYTGLLGRQALAVIGANVFTTHLLLQAVLAFLVVKDFEAGTVKEYIFAGYSKKEIFAAKYLVVFIESSIAILLSTGLGFLWKTVQNGYGTKMVGEDALFLIKIFVGTVFVCAMFSALSLLLVVLIRNSLAVGGIFIAPGLLDLFASLAALKLNAPDWVSIRYLSNCFYSSVITGKSYGFALGAIIIIGIVFGMIGFVVFRKVEYR